MTLAACEGGLFLSLQTERMFAIIILRGDSMKKFYQLYIVRNEAGESTADVGKLIGLSKASYWNRESGKTPFTLPEAFTLAEHYGRCIEELFPETLLIKK